MDTTYDNLQEAYRKNDESMFRLSYFMSFLGFIFGTLIEWRGIKQLLQRNVNPSWLLLLVAIALTFFSFIPSVVWGEWYGGINPFYIDMFLFPERNLVLTVLSGILVIRSLTYDRTK
ncbi:hypothetical protein [Pontibacillus yanchengensis]|nr:hypothetical protein [Pontibacillus yanchengensis]